MIVQCPNCQAKFRLPDDKVGPDGAKLRCGKCRHVFHVEPPAPPDFTDFEYPGEAAAKGPAEAEAAGEEAPGDLFHSESYEAKKPEEEEALPEEGPVKPVFSLDEVTSFGGGKGASPKERRKRVQVIAVTLFAVVMITLGAVYFLDLWPGAKKAAPPPAAPTAEKAPEAGKPAEKPEDTAKVKDIMLQNVRQYYVSNEKAGQLFVIEGKAVNNFKTPKEMIKLEASLFDEKGNVLGSKEVLAGNTVSLFQLQVMTKEELESALNSQVGVLTNNTNIAPAGEVAFMIVFFSPPEAVKEFGVKVVDAKDPPKQ